MYAGSGMYRCMSTPTSTISYHRRRARANKLMSGGSANFPTGAHQLRLGDDETAAQKRAALVEETAAILMRLPGGDISKPKQVESFFLNIKSKSVGGQQLSANCMYCKKLVQSTGAVRLVDHLAFHCVLCPDTVKKSCNNLRAKTTSKRKERDETEALNREESEQILRLEKAKKAAALKQLGIKASFKSAETLAADMAIAKFFYGNAISFAAADSKSDSLYKDMIRAVKGTASGYTPPNFNAIAGPLLDACYSQMLNDMQARDPDGVLADRFGVSYTQDGWDSVDHLPLINSAYITANDGGAYLRSVDTSGVTKNAEYIAGLMITDIYTIGPTKVIMVVTDTCSTMKKAWDYVMDEFPWLSCIHCQAHVASLLTKDVAKATEVISLMKDEALVVSWYVPTYLSY